MSLAGLALAVIGGMLSTELFIRVLEQPGVQFIRQPSILLWGAGALIEAFFILIISWIAFRRTREYQLREIAES